MAAWNACKVFSATMAHDREMLGDKVTTWLKSNPGVEVVETRTHQSSDQAFHCISIILFYKPAVK